MPDRYIRDEILDSERWLAVDCGAKLAFVACLLKCDTVGNLDAPPLRLYRLWRDFGAGTVEASEELLKALAAVDLVRVYAVDKKRFIHIPRFGQNCKYLGRLHPASPWDSEKRVTQRTKNQPIAGKTSVVLPENLQSTREELPENSTGVVVGVGLLRSGEENLKTATVAIPTDNARASGNGKIAFENKETPKGANGLGQKWDDRGWVMATALGLGERQRPGEDWLAFRDRIYVGVQAKLKIAKAKLKPAQQQAP